MTIQKMGNSIVYSKLIDDNYIDTTEEFNILADDPEYKHQQTKKGKTCTDPKFCKKNGY